MIGGAEAWRARQEFAVSAMGERRRGKCCRREQFGACLELAVELAVADVQGELLVGTE